MRTIITKSLIPSTNNYSTNRLLFFPLPIFSEMIINIAPDISFKTNTDVSVLLLNETHLSVVSEYINRDNLLFPENINEEKQWYNCADKNYLMAFQRENRDELIDIYFKQGVTFFARAVGERLMIVGTILQVLPYKI